MIRTYPSHTLITQTEIIKHISDNLSDINRQEVKILFKEGASVYDALISQAAATETGLVLFNDKGDPCGIGGIFSNHSVWLVVTDNLTRSDHVSFLKSGRRWFNEQAEHYRSLFGYCWSDNTLSMKWIKWLGFEFDPLESTSTWYVNGVPFLYFHKNT